MSPRKKGNKSTGSSKEIATLKMINKELVVNLQRIKKEAASSASQNCSLKAELYDLIMEKNTLTEKNIKLVELLRSLQQEYASIGKRIDDLLGPKDSDKSSRLPTRQSAAICPMVSGHVIHKPKVELRRLNFNDYPNMEYAPGNDEVCLSPVIEQQYEEPVHRFGQVPQNLSNIRNKEVAEKSFYSVGSWTVENTNIEASSSTSSSDSNNLSPSTSNESLQEQEGNPVEVKPSGSRSRLQMDENTSSSETGRNSNNGGRNSTSLLTINVISPKNDPQTSGFMLNPSVFVNVCPRKQKYGSRVSSSNQGFSLSNVKQESNEESQDSSYANIVNLKYPIVLSERLPAVYNESLTANTSGNTNKEEKVNKSKSEKTETKKRTKPYLRSSKSAEGSPKDNTTDSSDKRRSVRSRKAISYKE